MATKRFTRLFFATDVHGSEHCFRKFLSGASVYKADALILGGDITGKIVIPIISTGNGTFRADYLGREEVAKTPDELSRLEQLIADSGYYYVHQNEEEMIKLRASKLELDQLFLRVMKETLNRWVQYAEQILKKTETPCYITGGNDDLQEVLDGIQDTEHVKNIDGKVVELDRLHQMASMGWSNPTPWKCPRECDDRELERRIETLMTNVSSPENCIFNFHSPPINCGLDTVAKLDASVDPPKFVFESGRQVMIGAGSEAVRRAIERYRPLVDLCGHVHESSGVCKIGKTLVVNPGSEYSEGVLRGAIINVADKKILSWQLTHG
jgi:uncharacterized protein